MDGILMRYTIRATELQRHLELLRAAFAELESALPEGLEWVSYQVEGTAEFVEIAVGPDLPGPLPGLPAFQRYRVGLDERCEERVTAELCEVETYAGPDSGHRRRRA